MGLVEKGICLEEIRRFEYLLLVKKGKILVHIKLIFTPSYFASTLLHQSHEERNKQLIFQIYFSDF